MEPTAGKIFGLIGEAVRTATQAAMIPALAGVPAWRPARRPRPEQARRGSLV